MGFATNCRLCPRLAGVLAQVRGARHELPGGLTLFDSYHCSRYNTQTKRLSTAMFDAVIGDMAAHLVGTRFIAP